VLDLVKYFPRLPCESGLPLGDSLGKIPVTPLASLNLFLFNRGLPILLGPPAQSPCLPCEMP